MAGKGRNNFQSQFSHPDYWFVIDLLLKLSLFTFFHRALRKFWQSKKTTIPMLLRGQGGLEVWLWKKPCCLIRLEALPLRLSLCLGGGHAHLQESDQSPRPSLMFHIWWLKRNGKPLRIFVVNFISLQFLFLKIFFQNLETNAGTKCH